MQVMLFLIPTTKHICEFRRSRNYEDSSGLSEPQVYNFQIHCSLTAATTVREPSQTRVK